MLPVSLERLVGLLPRSLDLQALRAEMENVMHTPQQLIGGLVLALIVGGLILLAWKFDWITIPDR